MPAYMIALNRGVHDRKKLEEYWKAAGPTFESVVPALGHLHTAHAVGVDYAA